MINKSSIVLGLTLLVGLSGGLRSAPPGRPGERSGLCCRPASRRWGDPGPRMVGAGPGGRS